MSDAQGLRYEVFVQERPDGAYLHEGSVHAVDDQLALQNARDVYARRPECSGLWVIPASQMASATRQQIDGLQTIDQPEQVTSNYQCFVKQRSAGTHTSAQVLQADTSQSALIAAWQAYPDAWSILVCPQSAILTNPVELAESWFGPAYDKPFRQSSYYHVISEMRAIRDESSRDDED